MQGLIERAKQALRLGPEAFLASTLEAQEITLEELNIFAPTLKQFFKASKQFFEDTTKFLDASATYITEAPFPRIWMQGSPSEPAIVAQTPVPAEHAAWFDASVAEREAGVVPGAVSYALQRELLAPLEQWLWAHEVAQDRLSELQSQRLSYDGERRRLVQRATAATTAVAASHKDNDPHGRPPAGREGAVEDPALSQLVEDAAAVNVTLNEFESDVEALDDLLAWLVEGAVRIKAMLADTAGAMGVAAETWTIAPGIMPPFPEKSSFGDDVEVTVTLSDAPAGVTGKAEEVVANMQGALTSSETAGVRTITSFQPPHTSQPLGSSGSVAGPQADLSKVLPSDEAKVYGGGVAPPKDQLGIAEPSGGGVGQMLRDTVVAPAGAASGDSGDMLAAAAPVGPRSAHSYSGEGVGRVEARVSDAAASGLGAAQRRLGRARSAEVPAGGAASSAAAGAAGGYESSADEDADKKQLALAMTSPPAAETAAGSPAVTAQDPEDISPSAAHLPGNVGSSTEQGSHPGGIWAAIQRTVAEAGSAAASAAATVAAHVPGVSVGSGQDELEAVPEQQQHQEEHVRDAAGSAGDVEVKHTARDAAAATSVEEQGSEDVDTTGAAPFSSTDSPMHIGPVTPAEGPADPEPGSAIWFKESTTPGGAAASTHTSDQAASGAAGVAAEDAPVTQHGQMHIGPVTPAEGPADPEAGSAVWFKESTTPGGAAAAAAPAGDDKPESKSSSSTAAARSTAEASPAAGPDLSKILPAYEQGIPEPTKKPEGGSFGAFIKDTLFGPRHEK